jgi:hypothetical protein
MRVRRPPKPTLIAVEIVRKNSNQIGFAIQPQRWVVERFFARIGRNQRLARDFEATIDSAPAFLYAASEHPRCVGRDLGTRLRTIAAPLRLLALQSITARGLT